MTITLYINSSDERTVSKALSSPGVDVSGTARGEFPVTGGTILVESNDNLSGYNYAYISETGRYYYIEGINAVRSGLWALNLKVDVLMSYASQIREITGTVNRQENLYNGYIQDGKYQALSYTKIVAKAFPNGMTSDNLILMTVG